MSQLESIDFDARLCTRELAAFASLLRSPSLREREDILPFFRQHRQLAALLGSFHRNLTTYDRIAFELSLAGRFTADLVIGDSMERAFYFVEFEDAAANSIFARRDRHMAEWSRRFEHGFGQIVDWFWLLDDLRSTSLLATIFGTAPIIASAMLVIGRDADLHGLERQRLEWRRTHVVVNSQHVFCCTFDDLYRRLERRLAVYTSTAGNG